MEIEQPSLELISRMIIEHSRHRIKDFPESEDYVRWKEYFRLYNNDIINRQIGMSCTPCYNKVYLYIKKRYPEEE